MIGHHDRLFAQRRRPAAKAAGDIYPVAKTTKDRYAAISIATHQAYGIWWKNNIAFGANIIPEYNVERLFPDGETLCSG